ncbi:MAG: flavin-dependent oxidoreductase [Pseudonocardia sp.]|nr:flavin-dependent oxidoreductase [Pseudonocardia sp.]
MRVLIIGAGIGGLVTALRLHRLGIDCDVLEQGSAAGEPGVGINLLPHAVAELADLGLLDALDETAVRTTDLAYHHRLGQEIVRRPCGIDAGFAHPQLSIHRGRLRGVLLRAVIDRLGDGAVRAGNRVVGFEQDEGGVRARLVDRADEPAGELLGDVLVAADGIHSTVREILFPGEGPPRWNGVQMWRGATEWPAFRGGRSMVIAGGTAAKLALYPIGRGATPDTVLMNWAICLLTGRDGDPPPRRQDWSRPAAPGVALQHAERFHVPGIDHAALVAATEEILEFPMCDRDPLPSWSHGRVTLLGDAAHPMYPMGSNGAGQAILDAAALGSQLRSHDDPVAALLAYQDERLPATADVVLRNRTGGPEGVIDEVERRAPEGFDRRQDVLDDDELDAVLSGYAQATGALRARADNAPDAP